MLREKIPDFELALGQVARDVVVPRLREPCHVAFRQGADLAEVVRVVQTNRSVAVDAAPGAGKSTRLPAALAEAVGCMVLHVFPNERLADHVYDYVDRQGGDVSLVLDVDTPYPTRGVACVPAPVVVAKWLAAGAVVLPECVVFHDESHESDAYTYLVKILSLTADGVRSYVSATATSSATGFRSLETKGSLRRSTYRGEATAWDPYDDTGPWGGQQLRGNTLLYIDSRSLAASLMEMYAAVGCQVYRLSSRMTLSAFRTAMAAANDDRNPVVVLVADSTHRSGFTMNVSTILDSGTIGYMDTSAGRPVRRVRALYALEVHQTASRGARIPGQATNYYSPESLRPEAKICDLEQVDAEAVALILRMLGYAVPREFLDCKMSRGMVPRDLCAALQREQPLALMREEQLVSLDVVMQPSGRRSPYLADDVRDYGARPIDVADVRVSADVARTAGRQRYARVSDDDIVGASRAYTRVTEPDELITLRASNEEGRRSEDAPRRTKAGNVHPGWDDSWQSDLEALLAVDPGVTEMKLGRAYGATGLETDTDRSTVFPDGADSVLRLMQNSDRHGSLASLGGWHKSIAVNLLLGRQGALAAEMDGIRRAIVTVKREIGALGTPAMRSMAVRVAEQLAAVSSSLNHVNDVLVKLGRGFCAYHEMEINAAMSTSVCENWLAVWRAVPSVDSRDSLRKGFAIEREGASSVARFMSDIKPRLADRPYVPMARRGAGMRAIQYGTATTRSSGSSSVATDDRCTGATYWRQGLTMESGRLCHTRTLVCEQCGSGASKRRHGK